MLQSISEVIRNLATDPWVTMSGWLFGLLGLAALFRGTRKKIPTYALDQRVIFEDLSRVHPDLAIRFRDQPVNNLGLTTVYVWNEGAESVRASDFSANDPLRVVIPDDVTVLHAEITNTSSEACGFALNDVGKPNTLQIAFEHMDHRQGVEVAVLHTLASASSIKVQGTMIGAGKLSPVSKLTGPARRFIACGVIAMAGALLAAIVASFLDASWKAWPEYAFGSGLAVLFVGVIWESSRRYRYNRIFPQRGRYRSLGEWSRNRLG